MKFGKPLKTCFLRMSCLRKNNENFISFCNRLLGIKPCGLGARIQDVKAFFIQNTIFLLEADFLTFATNSLK